MARFLSLQSKTKYAEIHDHFIESRIIKKSVLFLCALQLKMKLLVEIVLLLL